MDMVCTGEGPVGMIVCPSRELARQTHEVIQGYIQALKEDGYPQLRSLLVMGGVDMKQQVRNPACHYFLVISLDRM
jgi:ATP-dependent RNA helicase DDX41